MEEHGWEQCGYPGVLRPVQVRALDVVGQVAARGRSRAYLVLPAGSGKTVVGLEAARRLGRRTLVLTPNTAVQGQWLQQWERFAPAGPHPQPASGGRLLKAGLTVLTYQSLSVWDRACDDEDEVDDTSPGIAERRRLAVRDPDGHDLLSLLHPRGRDLVEAARSLGPWTLVLDECHHLLETWGPLTQALVRALGPDTWVVGLCATPSGEASRAATAVREAVFGDDGCSTPLPAVVKDGGLAPFQELVLLTVPTPEEDSSLIVERTRFADLREDLLTAGTGSLPLLDWLWRRLHDRRTASERLTWGQLCRAEPELARAGLRLVHAGLLSLPTGARLQEQHRVPPDGQDWAVVLGAYAAEQLAPSRVAADQVLLRRVREVLPSLGHLWTSRGLRPGASPVERLCALSSSKHDAAQAILLAEHGALGPDLRALVLGDAQAHAQQTFLALARSELAEVLRPVLCTGRTVALRRSDLAAFRASCPPHLADRLLADRLPGEPADRSVVRVEAGAGWSARVWVPLVTAWLASGGTRAVVGTRGLLGRGWDCPSLNVLVDLTSASAPSAVDQVRGRALRLDPGRPDKVADTWTVVCVADDHPAGDADFRRAVANHRAHLAPGADGVVQAGIGHCDDALEPYVAPDARTRAEVNARALARPRRRAASRQAWAVGAGYAGLELTTLHLELGASLGLPGGVVPPSVLVGRSTLGSAAPAPLPVGARARRRWPLPLAGAGVAAAGATAWQGPLLGAVVGVGAAGLTAGGALRGRYHAQLAAFAAVPADSRTACLRQLSEVVADALHDGGGACVGAAAVRLAADGSTVELEAPAEQSALFATCLDELLAPLAEPRWLVSRLVLAPPTSDLERRRLARTCALGRPVEAAVAWHAVPTWCGLTRARVEAFETAWRAHVGPGRLVLARDPEGTALLDLLGGEDVLGVRAVLRRTWR